MKYVCEEHKNCIVVHETLECPFCEKESDYLALEEQHDWDERDLSDALAKIEVLEETVVSLERSI